MLFSPNLSICCCSSSVHRKFNFFFAQNLWAFQNLKTFLFLQFSIFLNHSTLSNDHQSEKIIVFSKSSKKCYNNKQTELSFSTKSHQFSTAVLIRAHVCSCSSLSMLSTRHYRQQRMCVRSIKKQKQSALKHAKLLWRKKWKIITKNAKNIAVKLLKMKYITTRSLKNLMFSWAELIC